ncbi:MAG: GNAT family N-acetyltransferase [Alphaproteobacteria bacterium]
MTLPIDFQIRLEHSSDEVEISALQMRAFGPGAAARAAFRVREQAPHDLALSFVAMADNSILGSVRLTPIAIGERTGLLLGPLVVTPDHKNQGIGRALVRHSVEVAGAAYPADGDEFVILVGDQPYYGPVGFSAEWTADVRLPAPVDKKRLLAVALCAGGAKGLAGLVRGIVRPD